MDKYIEMLNEAFKCQFEKRFAIFAETVGSKDHAIVTFRRSVNSLIEDYRGALKVLESIHEETPKAQVTQTVGGDPHPRTAENDSSQGKESA